MPNYQNGKIYKLTSEETELIYIGSTCNTLKKRLCKHKSVYRTNNKNSTSKQIVKYADVKIELIENFPCNELIELLFREGEICKNTPNHCNTQIQGRTMKEYRDDNKEKLKDQCKVWRHKNKDIIAEKKKAWSHKNKDIIAEKYKIYAIKNREAISAKRKISNAIKIKCHVCECEITKCNLARHLKSKSCKSI